MTEVWDSLLSSGYDEILYIPMSSGLSGSCQTARMLAEDYGGKVQVVNNHRISVTQRQSVQDALALRKAGYVIRMHKRRFLKSLSWILPETYDKIPSLIVRIDPPESRRITYF